MVFDNNDVLLFLAATFETSLSKNQREKKLLLPADSKISPLSPLLAAPFPAPHPTSTICN